MNNIEIYTDGGCSGNPGPGGWAYVIIDNETVIEKCSGNQMHTTNNQMELTAVIKATEKIALLNFSAVIHTDSQYVKNGITKWIFNWKKNGWKTANKKPVKNKELWMALDESASKIDVQWKWVKGHAGIEYNEMCDSMVGMEMDKIK